jgi:hypothetical protein
MRTKAFIYLITSRTGESGAEATALQTLRDVEIAWPSRSVWIAARSPPL